MAKANLQELAEQPWPVDGLERLGRCPVCGTEERSLLHDDLWDNSFFAAPGKWTMWRCSACQSGYLDPRPDAATIGLAYSKYYTHQSDGKSQPARRGVRAALGNGYRNARYGTKLEPSHPLGRLVAVAFPGFRQGVDTIYRYLPKRRDGAASRVLDIGSGSGDWLLVARAAGWHAVGSDPDPAARAAASASGLEVRKGGAEAWADQLGTFDAVSMNHVIEHVHQPLETLRTVFALLRPGGQLYIEAPNLDALGHLRFGRNWRGLEAPRHLVIFNRRGMSDTLRKAGFVNIRFRQQRSIFLHLSEVSARMEAGFEPYDENAPAMGAPALMDKIRARLTRTRAEFLTLTCIKPGEDDGERARG